MLLEQLYKEAILAHSKRPRNHREIPGATVSREGLNPSCGDELTLYLQIADNRISDVSFVGVGCAISQASASMMTEVLKGKTLTEARDLSEKFRAMIQGGTPAEDLGELRVLQGVAKLHARVKCATLAWVTLEEAMAEQNSGARIQEPEFSPDS